VLFVASSQVLVFKNVSRKGAKEQREKENSFDVVLLVEICQRLRNRSDAEPAEDARRIEWFQREIGTTTSFAPKVDLVVTRFVLVRVTSWIVLVLLNKTKRSTNSHELNTKLSTNPGPRFALSIATVLFFTELMSNKILSPDQMLRVRKRLRSEGLRLVFTNGVFDLLHVGHLRYLEAARALGDALVVAINSDRTTRELKGPDRPITNESERAELLAALRCVDYVTIFDDVSPRTLITDLLPDVLVKGGDYELDQIHGREEVEAAGGKVVALPFVGGASTTTLIERMRMSDKL